MAEQGGMAVTTGLRYRPLALVALLGLGATVAAFTLLAPAATGDATAAREAAAVVRIADGATHGAAPDFAKLRQASDRLDAAVARAAPSSTPSPAPGSAAGGGLAPVWSQLRPAVQTMLAQESSWQRAADGARAIAAAVHPDPSGQGGRGLAAIYQALLDRSAPNDGGAALAASGQLATLERIGATAQRLLAEGAQAQQLAATLPPLLERFSRNNETLLGDPQIAATENAQALRSGAQAFASAVERLQDGALGVEQLALAATQIAKAPADLVTAATGSAPARDATGTRLGIGAGIVAALSLLAFVLLNGRRPAATASAAAAAPTLQDPQQQQAILKLLDEITNLANGDLTVDMTVTEDFTGAIADSINYTVQTLRGLVGTINQTSGRITASAASTQEVASQLSAASETQARQVAATAETLSAGAQSLLDIAARAERMAIEAQNSVQVAHNGAATVGRTIQNMAALREQIQDTAKRIKRLGESSQEVGSITEVINELAEQTNTLALNASIQAKNAGEQNRGFALIADQVQELAERAASATRQIETLVKTIQADTGEAVISMERSTTNVVAGATSAEEAGQALTRIEASSQELATSVQAIALSARVQSAESVKVAGAMQSLRVIAQGTSLSADRTSQAVTELNALADRLRESVAGFKLPDDAAG